MAQSSTQGIRQSQYLTRYAEPLLALLREPSTLDVVVNPDSSIWVNRLGRGFEREGTFGTTNAELLLNGIATVQQRPLDYAHPILETIFPLTGDRIEGIIPPVVPSAVIAIRTRQRKRYLLEDLDQSGVLTDQGDSLNKTRHRDDFMEQIGGCRHVDVIRHAVRYRRNILVVGPAGAGKTTFSNSILAECAALTPQDRILIIEDTPELQCASENSVQLLETAQASMLDLMVASMRLIPRRLIVGEVRKKKPAQVLMGAWNTGHSGGLCTIHADDAISGLRKLENLMGGRTAVRERIASAIHLVIFIDQEDAVPAGRKVREILVIRGFDRTTQDYRLQYV